MSETVSVQELEKHLAGTRIAAQPIREFLAVGDSVAEVLETYPTLSDEDVFACLAYGVL